MDKKPSPTQKKVRTVRDYLPHIIVASVMYFAVSILWLSTKNIGLPTAALVSLSVFIFMSGMVYVAAQLRRTEKKSDDLQSNEPENSDDANKKAVRRQARIDALGRDTQATRDQLLRVGAVISVGLLVFSLGMRAAFGLTAEKVYFIPWWGLAIIWFFQIVLFPRWLTYTSFVTMAGLRVGIQIFGLGILSMLPNFIMLPFFYLLMMFFMFGSIMLPSLFQVKENRPGQGDWAIPDGATRGQPQARAVFETTFDQITAYVEGQSKVRPPRGILSVGGPGTGKTLLAKEYASKMAFPFIYADGNVFNPPFMGFAPIMIGWVKGRVEGLAHEYGWAVLFVDECDTLFGMRSGMQPQRQMGIQDFNVRGNDLAYGRTTQGPTEHDVMFLPGAGGGGNMGIYSFLTWMDGVPSPPFLSKLARGTANTLLSVFLPVTAFGKILRLPPAKAQESNVLFIGATNRPWMIDSAMERPGRLEKKAHFNLPDEMSSYDIAQYYIKLGHKEGYYRDELLNPDLIWAFARANIGQSPAEIERAIRDAIPTRVRHLNDLRRIMKLTNRGGLEKEVLAALSENERRQREMDLKFWRRHVHEIRAANGDEITDGWDERVNWDALTEALSEISWGAIRLEAIHPETQKKVAFHEVGHFLVLVALLVKRFKTIPTVLTALPRGEGTLGKVVYLPNDPRETHNQVFYESALRVALGAWTAERYCFGINLPGVSGDLQNATGLTALESGKWGMPPLQCRSNEEQEHYRQIGFQLISEPETTSFLNPSASALVERALAGERRNEIALRLGMAAVDNYRLLRANKGLYTKIVAELIENDEVSGQRLTELQAEVLTSLVDLDQMSEEDRTAFPANDFAVVNPFYGSTIAEGADIVEKVEALLREGGQP